MLRRKTEEGWCALCCGRDGASVRDDVLASDVLFQFEHVDVVVTVLVRIANSHVPHPKVGKPGSDGPISVVTSVVFDDGDVTGFTGG